MASAIQLRPLISVHHRATPTRFLASRNNNRSSQIKWTEKSYTSNGANSGLRFIPNLHNPYHHPLHPPLSFRHHLLLPCPPLSFLLRPCSSGFRHSLRLMSTPQAASDSTQVPSSSTKTVRLEIKGRVQGVFYRDWTVENATQLGLKGWVRNRRDGSVETLLSGNPDAVQEMEQRCRRGPPSALITGLQVFPSTEEPGTGFERKQTV